MNKKLLQNFLLALAAVGIFVTLVTARNGSMSSSTPAAGRGAAGEIAWHTALEPALAKAKEAGKPVMIDFFATWCPPCKMLDAQTYTDAGVIAETKDWVMVRIDVDQNQALAQQYGIRSIPTLVVLNAEGKETGRDVGFLPPSAMLAFMERATPASGR